VAWVAGLPPAAIYAIVALATATENVFPPVPSDVIAALAAFLARQQVTHPVGVWLMAWSANIGGASLIYWAARRHGRAFFNGPVGRRFLSPGAIAQMEREYLRYGVVGIFFTRLVPGLRGFVAPFAGLVNLPARTLLLPVALAGALWYAAIIAVGTVLGSRWESIRYTLDHLNRALLVGGLMVIGAVVVWQVWQSRRGRSRQLLGALREAFREDRVSEERAYHDSVLAAAATLLLALARSDRTFDSGDLTAIEDQLRARWGIPGAEPAPRPVLRRSGRFASRMKREYDRAARLQLYRRLKMIVAGGDALRPHEERLLERAAAVLGLGPEDRHEAGEAPA